MSRSLFDDCDKEGVESWVGGGCGCMGGGGGGRVSRTLERAGSENLGSSVSSFFNCEDTM